VKTAAKRGTAATQRYEWLPTETEGSGVLHFGRFEKSLPCVTRHRSTTLA
jgi:hypothetical protein